MLEQQILDTFLFSPQWIDPVDPHPAGVPTPGIVSPSLAPFLA